MSGTRSPNRIHWLRFHLKKTNYLVLLQPMMSSFLSSSPMQKEKILVFVSVHSVSRHFQYNTLFQESNQIYQTKSYGSLENVLLAMT